MSGRGNANTAAGARVLATLLALLLVLALAARAAAQRGPVDLLADYTAITLAARCLEGDNDSRRGVEAEQECEQYIRGFLDALGTLESQMEVAGPAICLPSDVDALDAVRRNFTRWVFANFAERESPAGFILMRSLQDDFSCP